MKMAMYRAFCLSLVVVLAAACLGVAPAFATVVTINFNTEDDLTTPLLNGQEISTPPEFGNLFEITSNGPNLGPAIFDSNPNGPNDDGPDPDLLVGTGNVLILQNNGNSSQSTPDIYDVPNDDSNGGQIFFDFSISEPVRPISLTLIDRDNSGGVSRIELTDSFGRQRIVNVPNDWTGDINDGDVGLGTVDLESGNGTESPEHSNLDTTVTTDNNFDIDDVVLILVNFNGSGAIDNLVFDTPVDVPPGPQLNEPPFPACPEGYTQIDTFGGGGSEGLLRRDQNPKSRTHEFNVASASDILVVGWAKEGHPENPNCNFYGGSSGQCNQDQDFENFIVDVDGNDFGQYTDHVGPIENAWFPAGPWSTSVSAGDHDLTFRHTLQGSGAQSVHYKVTLCAAPSCDSNNDCDDNNPCTNDFCDNGECEYTPVNCPEGEVCDPEDGQCIECDVDTTCPPVEVVFIMDTSGSMQNDGEALCDNIADVISTLAGQGVSLSADILAINPNDEDDLFSCLDEDDTVRELFGDDVPGEPDGCTGDLDGSGSSNRDENWGPGTAIVAQEYPWTPGSLHIIVPISDEGPCLGNTCYNPGSDRDSILNAIDIANANDVIVSPITASGSDSCVIALAQLIADETGGIWHQSTDPNDDLVDAIANLVLDACEQTDACDDGNLCTIDDTCVDGDCEGTPIDCDDGNDCTVDTCNPNTGQCSHTPDNSLCSDGNYCNGNEVCHAVNGCQAGTPPDCNDGVACTSDSCDEVNDTCVNTPNHGSCSNGQFCDGDEVCDPEDGCVAGPPVNCNDGVTCTTDSCDEVNNTCVNNPMNSACSDGNPCNGIETCDPVNGCQAGTPPNCDDGIDCTIDSCDPGTGQCVHTPDNSVCNNGDFCDGLEYCDAANGCQEGDAPDCDDGVACTVDSCDEVNDTCVNAPNDSLCSNGQYCDGDEVCDAINGCEAGTAPNCDDGVACTVDTCDEVNNTCVNSPNDSLCSNGEYCDGAEVCDAVNGCEAGTPPNCNDGVACTNDSCDEVNDTCVNAPDDAQCSNGDFCDGGEVCDPVNGCEAGTAPNCDDGVACTVDTCDEVNDTCVNSPNDGACSNGQYCDGVETCDPINGCQAGMSPNCDDGVPCTIDSCDEMNDTCVNAPNNSSCSNGNPCDGVETCDPVNGCQAGTPPDCDDGIDCTIDTCDPDTGECVHTPDNSVCNNGAFCDGVEFCDAVNGCQAGTPPNCNDGVACTVDTCDEVNDTCVNSPDDSQCSNGQHCDGVEVCDPVNGCEAGTPPVCDDGVACTTDTCDEVNDTCSFQPNDSLCSNGQFCDGAEVCDPVNGCEAGTPPNCNDGVDCTLDSCDEVNDTCVNGPDDSFCDNGTFCDGVEICDPMMGCVDGADPDCGDGIPCTVDSCDPIDDVCVNEPDDSVCNNGQFCDGVEICDPLLGCTDGTDPSCDDGIACTNDSCDEVNDVCVHMPQDSLCANGLFCDGMEICDVEEGCVDGSDPCRPPLQCDEPNDTCVVCFNDEECDDGLHCNGLETCVAGECEAGTPVDCDDGVECTADVCDEATDMCVNTPMNSVCNDAQYCNGVEFCDPVNDCQAGTPPNCDDGVVCTVDSCDESTDTCVNAADNSVCDNDLYCDGVEFCDPVNDCQAGTPPNCDDGVICTLDSCDEVTDMCVNAPNDGVCDNGAFCDGNEFCDPVNDCQPGTSPNCDDGVVCTVDSCDEVNDTCVNAPSDGSCNNGQFCDGVEFCDPINDCQAGTSPDCDDGVVCTVDSCDEVNDTCVNAPDNGSCSNGEPCDGVEVCDPVNGCEPGTPPDCDDGIDCTIDSCDPDTGECVHTPDNGVCNNGDFCDGVEFCDAANGCQPGTPPDCDDGVACTVDSCDEMNDTCVNSPNDGACSNGQFCDGTEVCDPMNGCEPGTPPVCDDSVPCTVDTCDEINDTCSFQPNDSLCSNGEFCDGAEVCDPVNGCEAGPAPDCDDGVPCTVDSCDEVNDTCVNAPDNSVCNNGAFCDGDEVCDPVNGCQPGMSPDCNDGVACTVDACDEDNDTCVNTPDSGSCSNGQFCDGVEVCDPVNGCQPGTPVDCGDGVACTVDKCNEVDDVCVNTPSKSFCSNGNACDGIEICHPMNGCQPGTPPDCDDDVDCTIDSCNPDTGACLHMPDNSVCDNGEFCDGAEFCDAANGCQPGTPPNCDDGVACTLDGCDEMNDECLNSPDDSQCTNGQFCDGNEVCDPVNGCEAGPAVNCNDNIACTIDSCDEANDMCDHDADDSLCGNGQFCDGNEICNPLQGCVAGPQVSCGDGIACTVDTCDETIDECVNVANSDACIDSDECTIDVCGSEGCRHVQICGACCTDMATCVEGITATECEVGLNGSFKGIGTTCPGDEDGNGMDDLCQPSESVPTVSEWGLAVLALLLLTAAKLYLRRREEVYA